MNLIEVRELTKLFGKDTDDAASGAARDVARGAARKAAIDQLSFDVPAGATLGLIGPAGSGKTTTIRILATLLVPTSGEATIMGASVTRDPQRVRRITGYAPVAYGVYPDMTVSEYLRFFAASYGVPAPERRSLVTDLLELVDLSHRRDEPVGRLSPGMLQRLSLARALAHDPQILLLDEPSANLDPRARVEMRELLKELRSMGKAIVITSPVFADVRDMCTHAVILDRGRIALAGPIDEVAEQVRPERTISVKLFGNADLALRVVTQGRGVVDARIIAPSAPADDLEVDEDLDENDELDLADAAAGMATPAVTVLKELRVTFDGQYGDASELLRVLMRSGVQVVSFSEYAAPAQELLLPPDPAAES
jgi:ABC-2 type transport system ATP-binding protein